MREGGDRRRALQRVPLVMAFGKRKTTNAYLSVLLLHACSSSLDEEWITSAAPPAL